MNNQGCSLNALFLPNENNSSPVLIQNENSQDDVLQENLLVAM